MNEFLNRLDKVKDRIWIGLLSFEDIKELMDQGVLKAKHGLNVKVKDSLVDAVVEQIEEGEFNTIFEILLAVDNDNNLKIIEGMIRFLMIPELLKRTNKAKNHKAIIKVVKSDDKDEIRRFIVQATQDRNPQMF